MRPSLALALALALAPRAPSGEAGVRTLTSSEHAVPGQPSSFRIFVEVAVEVNVRGVHHGLRPYAYCDRSPSQP